MWLRSCNRHCWSRQLRVSETAVEGTAEGWAEGFVVGAATDGVAVVGSVEGVAVEGAADVGSAVGTFKGAAVCLVGLCPLPHAPTVHHTLHDLAEARQLLSERKCKRTEGQKRMNNEE